ncbi:hypothetical protein [Azospirillum thiophilum]|nr:hypothetical protein [Azospirillum thiophilum]
MITGFHAVRMVPAVLSCRLVCALFRHLAPDRIGDAGPSNA